MASKSKKLSIAAEVLGKEVTGSIQKINLEQIKPAAHQPRLNKDVNINILAESLDREGLLQPIVVTRSLNVKSQYIIIAGERRYRAAKKLGWSTIECRVLSTDEKETYKLAVIENIQRENLTPFEEAKSFATLKNQFHYKNQDLSQILGKSVNYISEILSIANITPRIEKEAKKLGINGVNLLIQLSIAEKNKIVDEFLEAYRLGEVTTVKTAKDFNKNPDKKTVQTSSSLQNVSTNDTAVKHNVRVSMHLTDKHHIDLEVFGVDLTKIKLPIEKIEKNLLV